MRCVREKDGETVSIRVLLAEFLTNYTLEMAHKWVWVESAAISSGLHLRYSCIPICTRRNRNSCSRVQA